MLPVRLTHADTATVLDSVLAFLTDIGHPDTYPEAREARRIAREQVTRARQAAANPATVLAATARDVLAEDIDAGAGAELLATARTNSQGAVEIAKEAERQANATALRAITGPALVKVHLAPYVEEKATQAAVLAPAVPRGVVDAATASDAGPEAAAAWSSLGAIAGAIDAAWDIHDTVITSGLSGEHMAWRNDLAAAELHYRNPWQGRRPREAQPYGTRAAARQVALLNDLEHDRDLTCLLLSEALDYRLTREGIRTRHEANSFEAVYDDQPALTH